MGKASDTDTFYDTFLLTPGTNPLEFLFGKQGEHPPIAAVLHFPAGFPCFG